MIDKSRKAVIRNAAINTRKQATRAIFELDTPCEQPMTLMMSYKEKALKEVCQSEEETKYFEVCFLHGSEKAAEEFELWAEGFWASFKNDQEKNKYEA